MDDDAIMQTPEGAFSYVSPIGELAPVFLVSPYTAPPSLSSNHLNPCRIDIPSMAVDVWSSTSLLSMPTCHHLHFPFSLLLSCQQLLSPADNPTSITCIFVNPLTQVMLVASSPGVRSLHYVIPLRWTASKSLTAVPAPWDPE